MKKPIVAAVYAVSENDVIGVDHQLPWKLPDDMKRFMQITTGSTVIMGRHTYLDLGKPLKNRRNLVISRTLTEIDAPFELFPSLEAALDASKDEERVFIIGGAVVYNEAFEKGLVDEAIETLVHAEVDGDTFFHPPLEQGWALTEVDARQADDRNEYAFTFRNWKKIT